MKRTRLVAALGLALLAAGCPAETPKTTPAGGDTSLGAPEAGSTPKKGVKPPVAPKTETPVAPAPETPATPPATPPVTPPVTPAAETTAPPAVEAPK